MVRQSEMNRYTQMKEVQPFDVVDAKLTRFSHECVK